MTFILFFYYFYLPEETKRNNLNSGTQKEHKAIKCVPESAKIYVVKHHRTQKLGKGADNTICTKQRTCRKESFTPYKSDVHKNRIIAYAHII